MKIIKPLAGAVGLVLLLVILGVAIFLLTFDANSYKQELSDLARKQTGRDLVFKGDIGLTLYPALGMKLGAMSLSNAPGFGDKPMFSVEQVSVSVDIFSLLRMQPEVDRLLLDGLKLNLHKNAKGVTNFDDLVKKEQPAAGSPPATAADTKAAPAEPAKPGASAAPWLAGSFGGLDIRNADLVWRDDTTGDEYRVTRLELVTGRIALDSAFPLTLKLSASNKDALKAELALETRVGLGQDQLELDGLRLNSSASGSMLPVNRAMVEMSGSFRYGLQSQLLAGKGFALKLDSQGGLMQKLALTVAGEIGFSVAGQKLDVAVLDVTVDAEDPSLPKGRVKAGLSAGTLALEIPASSAKLDDLRLDIDGNRFEGFLHAADYTRPDVTFRLSSKRLDIDGLLGLPKERPPQDSATETPGESDAGAAPAKAEDIRIALPMELLRKLKLDGQLQIGELLVQRLTLTNLDLALKAGDGIVDIEPLKLDLYEGQYNAAIRLDARGAKPAYQVEKTLKGFRVGKFLGDFMGKDPVNGRTDLAINLRSGGEWLSELKAGLNGDLDIAVRDGALKGFNLRHQIETAKAKFGRKEAPQLVERQTDFSALTLSGKVVNGVFSSNDLNLQAPIIRIGGEGSANLVEETVDYLVRAKVVTTTKGQAGGEADELSGLPIPVAITGPWLSPRIDVQYDEMIKAHLAGKKAALQEKLAAEKAQLQQKLAAEKARLEAEKQHKLEAEKARLEQLKQQAVDEQKARLEAQKLEQEQKARDKLKDKLKKLF